MKKEFQTFKTEIDGWVKDLSSQVTGLKPVANVVRDHTDNIDHNYEIIQELRIELTKLKEEVSALRMIQLLHLKSDVKKMH